MKNKIIITFLLLSTLVMSCKKAGEVLTEIKDKIIDAYWSDIDNLTIKIEGNEGYVVDFGTSTFGNNPVVFKPQTPYLKNINRTSSDKWDAEIIKSTYDGNGKLSGTTYEPTTINVSSQGNGNEMIVFSNADPKSKTWNKLPIGYTAPADPYHKQPIICDTVSNVTTNGNTLSARSFFRGDRDCTDILVRSRLYKPINHSTLTKCHYQMRGRVIMNGNITELNIYFSHKPTKSQIFTVESYGWGSSVPIENDHAIINFAYNYESMKNGAVVNVIVSGGKLSATLTNTELKYTGTGTTPNCKVSCVLND